MSVPERRAMVERPGVNRRGVPTPIGTLSH